LEKSNLDNLTIISFDENIGIAKGNNEGISYAMDQGCQKILLINNDVTFGPELLNELTEISISENAQLVVPKILFYKNDTVIWCAGGYFNPKLGYASIHRGEGEIDRGQFDNTEWVDYAPTCCMLVNTDIFRKYGLFDEKYFVYFDDTDFIYRLGKAGIKILYTPRTRLLHNVSMLTGGNSSAFSLFYGTRNKIYFLKKNFSKLYSLPAIILYIVYSLFKGIRLNKQKRSKIFQGIREGIYL